MFSVQWFSEQDSGKRYARQFMTKTSKKLFRLRHESKIIAQMPRVKRFSVIFPARLSLFEVVPEKQIIGGNQSIGRVNSVFDTAK